MLENVKQLSLLEHHQKVIINYTIITRRLIKNYFMEKNTTQESLWFFRKQSRSLLHDLKLLLKSTRSLSVVNQKLLTENMALLTLFEKSLTVTSSAEFTVDYPLPPTYYAMAG